MSEPISESLRTIQRRGADAFGATALATDVGPTVRRVARRRVGRAVGAGLAAVALVATVTVGALGYSGRTVSPALPSATPSQGADMAWVTVEIRAGDTGADIAQTLHDAGVIASVADFVAVANEHPDEALRIVPGHYVLPRGMEPLSAILWMLDSSNRNAPNATVPEGSSEADILARASEELGIPLAYFEAAIANPESLGLPPEANGNLEGWLAPGTYYFDPAATATDVLSAMVSATIAKLDEEGVAPADRMGVLTIASLIEREVKLDVDRPKIARVIQNRLDAGMALELDSTVQYAIWAVDSAIPTQAVPFADSPYNTYMVTGLPPGPIASPGEASIEAALHPADGLWRWFVTVNLETGETMYAQTFAEHVKNLEVLYAWLEANPAWTTGHPMDTTG